ncbi:MAG TPA: hypothetical protein VGT79_02065 [Xanthomonadaceae bacterium]|nr:hypothetical protein [Xanthomonadaceae bacterium]
MPFVDRMAASGRDCVARISMVDRENCRIATAVRSLMAGTTVQEKRGITNHPFIAQSSAWTRNIHQHGCMVHLTDEEFP